MERLTAPGSVPDHHWPTAEHVASLSCSASCYQLSEHIGFLAVVVPERELCKVQREILLADVVKVAHDATLEQAPERIDIRSVNATAYILTGRVCDGLMREAKRGQVLVTLPFVSRHQVNFVAHHFANEAIQGLGVRVFDHLTDDIALAADRADNWNLIATESAFAALFVPVLILVLSADIHFVNFNDTHQFLEAIVIHRGADTSAHVPDGLVTGLVVEHHALDLECAHSLLGMEHHKSDGEPSFERILGVLEYRAADERESIAFLGALLTLPVPSARQLVGLIVPATRTDRLAVRPAMLKQELFAGFFSRKEGVELAQLDHA